LKIPNAIRWETRQIIGRDNMQKMPTIVDILNNGFVSHSEKAQQFLVHIQQFDL